MARAAAKKTTAKSKKGGKLPFAGKRILLSNDDGIHAPGLKTLEKIARQLSDDIWIVAPETEQSGASHSLTLADPLRIRKVNARKFAVSGTPSDSIMMAVRHILKDKTPDLVLSGVNRGQNVADDVTYSGTIAAAMEGTILGIPSIALSQAFGFGGQQNVKWATAEHYAPELIERLVAEGWPKEVLININFPDVLQDQVQGVEVTSQGRRDQSLVRIDERVDARHRPYYWIGFEAIRSNPARGTDLHAIYNGRISITPLHMTLTHERSVKTISKLFGTD
ncbi:5'/3'-nucleotidase SurE [Tepidicaulis sp. LMO-SS28]|uniref:5'/3'-nucleotidase SurE n=1 Tax=Tepidicaulis sp. LMO-SS28 TaxID=3447455 RepID=UPI003EE19C44